MKKYYYLKDKESNGPFSLEEFQAKNITSETFVWVTGMEDWQRLKDVPEIYDKIKTKNIPPPPPISEELITKIQDSEYVKTTEESGTNPQIKVLKPSNNNLRWFIAWAGIHLFALITSYSKIPIFSNNNPKTDMFWPFVKIHDYRSVFVERPGQTGSWREGNYVKETIFNGIFYQYDWSEFAVYVGGAIIIYFLVKLSI
jgi:hypothetical protein